VSYLIEEFKNASYVILAKYEREKMLSEKDHILKIENA
jgi:hypothetical protein